jgi:sugar/nucleoside kinase (ribokinase family)
MPVDGPRQQRFDEDVPKTIHGVAPVSLHLVQAVDPKGYRRIALVAQVANDQGSDMLFGFPPDFWDNMGKLPEWLEQQIRPVLFPEEVEAARTNSEKRRDLAKKTRRGKTKQLPEDAVDVMEV